MQADIKRLVGKRIRVARVEAELSQTELAERLGLTQNSVSKWEKGETSIGIETLGLIADALGRPIIYFFQPFEEAVPLKKAAARR